MSTLDAQNLELFTSIIATDEGKDYARRHLNQIRISSKLLTVFEHIRAHEEYESESDDMSMEIGLPQEDVDAFIRRHYDRLITTNNAMRVKEAKALYMNEISSDFQRYRRFLEALKLKCERYPRGDLIHVTIEGNKGQALILTQDAMREYASR